MWFTIPCLGLHPKRTKWTSKLRCVFCRRRKFTVMCNLPRSGFSVVRKSDCEHIFMFHEFLVYLWRNLCSSPLPVFNLDLLLLLHCSSSLYGTVAQSPSHTQLFVIHGLQHTRPPCLSPSLKFMSIDQWCHPTVSSSITLFSSCLQSSPASESFPMNWLFTSGGQGIGALTSASVLPMSI